MAVLSKQDKILIKSLNESLQYGSKKLVKIFPGRNWKVRTVSYFLKHLRETNGSLDSKPGRGRKRSARTQRNILQVSEIVENSPSEVTVSSRKIAKATRIKRSSIRRILKYDLTLRPFKKIYCQMLTNDVKQKRLQRCQELLRRFRSRQEIRKIWFTDEKIFSLRQPKNSQNNRVYSSVEKKNQIPLNRLLVPRQHFANSVMVSLGVSTAGKTRIYFLQNSINSAVYQTEILSLMLPEIEDISLDYIFQQDGAPAHTSQATIQFLRENCPAFIEPPNWPPNSPDLNPVDYTVWGVLESMVYENGVPRDIEQLKERINLCWQRFPQQTITSAINQWRRRLQAVVNNHGGHIHNVFL